MPDDESLFGKMEEEKGTEIVAVRIIIEGRVQKVGLRNWIRQQALRTRVYGWVRNRRDTSVEAMLYGSKSAVTELIQGCYQGPSFAHVKRIREFPQTDVENPPKEFSILPTM